MKWIVEVWNLPEGQTQSFKTKKEARKYMQKVVRANDWLGLAKIDSDVYGNEDDDRVLLRHIDDL